jgi:diguanylate cyclase (GGDEF)-like protein/PAS domain S-box-containing protein
MAINRIRDREPLPSAQDLAERLEAAERGRYEAEAKYEALMRQLPAAIYVYSPELDGPTFNMSPYIEELLGVPPEVFTEDEEVWDRLIHPEDRDRARIEYEWFLNTGQPEAGEYRYVRPDGRVVWVRDHSSMIRDEDGTPLFIQGVMTDITPTKEAQLRMQHLAFHDPLTGLPNRAMFEQHLGLALARARRDDLAVAVLFLDLDAFKPVNDTHGHASGDEVLRQLASRLRSAVRETDLVARQGGDEFLVLIADLPLGAEAVDANAAVSKVNERIAEVMAEPFRLRAGELSLRASVGCALFPVDGPEVPDLLRRADEAMYEHKRDRSRRPTPLRRLA